MIDMHSHILPYVDDGARDIYEALEMAYIAVENGTTVMVATPHANQKGMYANYISKDLNEIFMLVQDALRKEKIPLTIIPGMEIFVTEEIFDLIACGRVCPYPGTNIYLIEFPFQYPEYEMEREIQKLLKQGVRPMLAHPERYYCIQDNIKVLKRFINLGCLVQMNKGSVFNRFGAKSGHTARNMLEYGMVHVVGSDAHGVEIRTPNMTEIKDYITRYHGDVMAKQILDIRPRKLLEGVRNHEVDS